MIFFGPEIKKYHHNWYIHYEIPLRNVWAHIFTLSDFSETQTPVDFIELFDHYKKQDFLA